MKNYINFVNRTGDVAEVPVIYTPAWPDIENYVEGLFWDTNELGLIPEPQTPEGYTWKRMIKLEGEGAPLVFYTYEPLPEPEETQVQRLTKEVENLRAADLDNKSMINDLGETLLALLEG